MKTLLKTTKVLILLIVIGIMLIIAKNFILKEPIKLKKTISSDIIFAELIRVNEMITTKYPYKSIGVFSDTKEFYGIEIPFTSKKFILSFSGTINAGIELSKIKVDLDKDKKTLTISLPQAKILSNDFSHEGISIYDEETALFNPIKIEDYKEFAIAQEDKIVKEAIDSGLLDITKDNAKENIKNMLKLIDETLVSEYSISFR